MSDDTVTSDSELGSETTVPGKAATVRNPDDPALPATIGRYRILRRLGAGGMGVVYAAHDPELGRTVAIKRVRERLGGLGVALRERLRREAQALARLSHPNVVSIHDVGVDDDQLFIVMQYVDGAALDDWIAERAPELDGMVGLYMQAGRGLAAAHAAGLVHRDFKPSNVLVERDGTVRVTDFGLARLSHLADEPSDPSGKSALDASMTDGDVVGTPAYMAPEQFLGGAITPATDQFGFCVALWEALAGARPFAGRSLESIRSAVVNGAIEPPPRPIPARIARALRRGLSVKAADRFGDMDALLAELAPRRRWWLAGGTAVALVGGGALAAVLLTGSDAPPNPCAAVAAPLDEVWSPARREAVRATLEAAGGALDPTLGADVASRIDDRARRWRLMRTDACEATRVRRTETVEVMDRRVACLDRSLDGLRAAIELVTAPDLAPGIRLNARNVVGASVDPSHCTADVRTDFAGSRPAPPSLALRVAVLAAHADAQDWTYVGRVAAGLATELEEAGALADAARAWYILGNAGYALPVEPSREASRRAAVLAEQIGNDDLAVRAWAWTAELAAEAGDFDAVDDLLAMAQAAATRSGGRRPQAYIDVTRGTIASRRGDQDAAIELCERVRADLVDDPAGDARELHAHALECLGSAYLIAARWDDAERTIRDLLALYATEHGEQTNLHTYTEVRLAGITFLRGDHAAARAGWRAALAKLERLSGAESTIVMDALSDIALWETEGGNVATPEGVAAIDRAVALGRALLGPEDPDLARVLEIQGNIHYANEDHAGGAAAYQAALAIYDRSKDLRRWAPLAYNAADGYRIDGACDRAAPLFERVIRLSDGGEADRYLGAAARGGLGVCVRTQGDPARAIEILETAAADLDALGMPDFAAQYRLEIAETEKQRGRTAEARRIAQAVKATLPDDSETNRQLRRWADSFR